MKTKSYIVLGQNYSSMDYIGQTEESFCMGYSDKVVRVYEKDKYLNINRLIKDTQALNKSDHDHEWKVYRVGSRRCPVRIIWDDRFEMKSGDRKFNKYQYRNLWFGDKLKTKYWK